MNKKKGIRLLALLCALLLSLAGCSQDYSRMYQKAVDTFATGDYAEAARLFGSLGDYANAPVYAAYCHGLLLFERGDYAEAAPYFEKSLHFMYGQSRYAYCNAYILEEAGAYAEAAEIFFSLGDFEDAAHHGYYCQGLAAEATGDYQTALYAYEQSGAFADTSMRLLTMQQEMYAEAIELKNKKEYLEALTQFNRLDNYFDSVDQARECKELYRRQLYAQAEKMETEGRLQEAYEAFRALSGYDDADTRAQELGQRLGIPVEDVE